MSAERLMKLGITLTFSLTKCSSFGAEGFFLPFPSDNAQETLLKTFAVFL